MQKLMFINCTLGNLLDTQLAYLTESSQSHKAHSIVILILMKLNASVVCSYSTLYFCIITCLRLISLASYIRIGACLCFHHCLIGM